MDVFLLVEKGSQQTRLIVLKRPRTIVGRRRGCDVRIPSGLVSRQHCVLLASDESLTVEDLNSANGTFLNGERVQTTRPVHPGDRLTVGPVTFLVQYEPGSAAVPMAAEVVPIADVVVLEEEEDWGEDLGGMDEQERTKMKPQRRRPSR